MSKTYIVNTNQAREPKVESDMLKNEKCAAYYDPWKYSIDAIESNDIVFLYSNGKGIIARGIATGIPEIVDFNGDTDEEHYMNLSRFQILLRPLPASKITVQVGHKLKFNQVVISLSHKKGIDLWQHITKYCV